MRTNESYILHLPLQPTFGHPANPVCPHIKLAAQPAALPPDRTIARILPNGCEVEVLAPDGLLDVLLECRVCKREHYLVLVPALLNEHS